MKIYNCYRELDKTISVLENTLFKLNKQTNTIVNNIEELKNKGWNDAKYINLKNVIIEKSDQINALKNQINNAIINIKERSDLIKNYYEIQI